MTQLKSIISICIIILISACSNQNTLNVEDLESNPSQIVPLPVIEPLSDTETHNIISELFSIASTNGNQLTKWEDNVPYVDFTETSINPFVSHVERFDITAFSPENSRPFFDEVHGQYQESVVELSEAGLSFRIFMDN